MSAAVAEARATQPPDPDRVPHRHRLWRAEKAGTAGAHDAPLGAEEIEGTRAAIGWSHAPFDIPAEITDAWREVGAADAPRATPGSHADAADTADFDAAMKGDFNAGIDKAVGAWSRAFPPNAKLATRVASQKAIEAILPACPSLIGGSADLTGSNNTRVGGQDSYGRDNAAGSYVHGVREHGWRR